MHRPSPFAIHTRRTPRPHLRATSNLNLLSPLWRTSEPMDNQPPALILICASVSFNPARQSSAFYIAISDKSIVRIVLFPSCRLWSCPTFMSNCQRPLCSVKSDRGQAPIQAFPASPEPSTCAQISQRDGKNGFVSALESFSLAR